MQWAELAQELAMAATRRVLFGFVLGLAATALAACGQGAGTGAPGKGDYVLGADTAKITVVEYASMTCGGCAQFHVTDFPKLKSEYIETGKIKYILKPYPSAGFSPQVSMAQFLLARCIATDAQSYYAAIGSMFGQFNATAQAFQSQQIRPHLLQLAQSAGLSQERFEACIADKTAIAEINAGQEAAVRDWKIERTPTFVINGVKVDPNTFEGLKPLIDAKLDGK
jgi:protein-disulfide isomerase